MKMFGLTFNPRFQEKKSQDSIELIEEKESGLEAIRKDVKENSHEFIKDKILELSPDEMEALTAASAAALTIYDMCKAVDRNMTIGPTMLISKTGGKSSDHLESFRPVTAILVLSDSVSKGISEDISGEILKKGFSNAGCSIKHFEIIPDNKKDIEFCIQSWIMEGVDLILTTGGTGLGSRDNTVQVVSPLLQKRLHGIEEALHRYGSTKNKRAMLSRLIAGSVSSSMIICLPGSPGAVRDAVNVLIPTIFHGFDMIKGKAHNKNH